MPFLDTDFFFFLLLKKSSLTLIVSDFLKTLSDFGIRRKFIVLVSPGEFLKLKKSTVWKILMKL